MGHPTLRGHVHMKGWGKGVDWDWAIGPLSDARVERSPSVGVGRVMGCVAQVTLLGSGGGSPKKATSVFHKWGWDVSAVAGPLSTVLHIVTCQRLDVQHGQRGKSSTFLLLKNLQKVFLPPLL